MHNQLGNHKISFRLIKWQGKAHPTGSQENSIRGFGLVKFEAKASKKE